MMAIEEDIQDQSSMRIKSSYQVLQVGKVLPGESVHFDQHQELCGRIKALFSTSKSEHLPPLLVLPRS